MINQRQTLFFIFLWIICTVVFLNGSNTNNSFILHLSIYIIIASTAVVINSCLIRCFKMREILSPIFVANIFLAFVFIARPIQIVLSENNINNIYVIGMYNRLGGKLLFNDLPILQASYIGFIGIIFMDMIYFGFNKKLLNYKTNRLYLRNPLDNVEQSLNIKKILGIIIIMYPVLLSMISFVIKQIFFKITINMLDIIWVYIICALIIYLITIKKRASFFIYFLIVVSALVLGIASRRMYVVNLIICFIVPLYYVGKNYKKNMRKIILMIILLFVLVLIYGTIRAERIGASQGTIVERLLDEFCMYDMLVVSLKHCDNNNIGLFYGYNFLTIFTTVISGFGIEQFDHELTMIVFDGLFNGGIPVTLFGSLYFNFSYLGVIIGALILGFIFRYMRNICIEKISIKRIMYYSIFTTFAYDIIRVGDIGREVWTCIIMILISKIFMLFFPSDNGIEEHI